MYTGSGTLVPCLLDTGTLVHSILDPGTLVPSILDTGTLVPSILDIGPKKSFYKKKSVNNAKVKKCMNLIFFNKVNFC